MQTKVWFLLRLLVFVFTIRYAAALVRCIPEYAWVGHPSYLMSPSHYVATEKIAPKPLGFEEADQVRVAVNALNDRYEQLTSRDYQRMENLDKWMASVDASLWKLIKKGSFAGAYEWADIKKDNSKIETEKITKEIFPFETEIVTDGVFADDIAKFSGGRFEDEAAKEEFFLAYNAYRKVVADIVAELNETHVTLEAEEDDSDSSRKACEKLLADNAIRHRTAAEGMLKKLPAPASTAISELVALSEWRDTYESTNSHESVLSGFEVSPCEKLWAQRYNDKDFAHTLIVISQWFLAFWLLTSILRLLDQLFVGTHAVEKLQRWAFGLLWSVYYDAPRHVVLWLLRKIDPKANSPEPSIGT